MSSLAACVAPWPRVMHGLDESFKQTTKANSNWTGLGLSLQGLIDWGLIGCSRADKAVVGTVTLPLGGWRLCTADLGYLGGERGLSGD